MEAQGVAASGHWALVRALILVGGSGVGKMARINATGTSLTAGRSVPITQPLSIRPPPCDRCPLLVGFKKDCHLFPIGGI